MVSWYSKFTFKYFKARDAKVYGPGAIHRPKTPVINGIVTECESCHLFHLYSNLSVAKLASKLGRNA
jgi:hypothetical protein